MKKQIRKQTLINDLLDKKAEKNNTIDLNAYASGLNDMFEALLLYNVNNWVACDERLPKNLQTVWLANKEKKWVCLGCLVDTNEGWHWAESNGVIYVDEYKIVSECDSDDLDVTHWCALPELPC